MAYDRWGMTPTAATTLTGADPALDDAAMTAAEDEIREALGWFPNPNAYDTGVDANGAPVDVRAWTMGRAIAWQAAFRNGNPAAAADGDTDGYTSENIGRYSYSKPETLARVPEIADRILAPRVVRLLARGGWFSRLMTGATGGDRVASPHDWQRG